MQVFLAGKSAGRGERVVNNHQRQPLNRTYPEAVWAGINHNEPPGSLV